MLSVAIQVGVPYLSIYTIKHLRILNGEISLTLRRIYYSMCLKYFLKKLV